MKLVDYKKLVDCNFVSRYGGQVTWYFSQEERAENYDYKEVESELMKQLTCDFDNNNCVILFPLATRYGTTMLFNNGQIVIDHCTYVLDIGYFLKSKGVTWKDGSKLKVDSSFPVTPMLFIENGLAEIINTANPLGISDRVGDKEIFFSGFLVNRLRSMGLSEIIKKANAARIADRNRKK
jgi:hypothetical protein